ncbi:MAG: lipocalin family protein, partial [Prevotella sp.]|nr:lipocalin family protein [Prevotella sp.]
RIILNTDTFLIDVLGPDSLYLENDNGIFAYKRVR